MKKIRLANGVTFESDNETTILASATKNNIILEHSCKNGRCGVCRARITKGKTKELHNFNSLTQEEKQQNIILTCCHAAETDIELNVENISGMSSRKPMVFPCRIEKISPLSQHVLEIQLRTPPTNILNFEPGQYIDIIKNESLRRSYSIANSPRHDNKITLHVSQIDNGEMSNYWFHHANVNDLLRLEGPFGTFRLRRTSAENLIFLATGTGIAPIKAILENLNNTPTSQTFKKIFLYWGIRKKTDLYWSPTFKNLSVEFTPCFSREHNADSQNLYVQDAVIKDSLILNDTDVYACGSAKMITSAKQKLSFLGLERTSFYSDAFVESGIFRN